MGIAERRNSIYKDPVVRRNYQKVRVPGVTRGAKEAGSPLNFPLEVNRMLVRDISSTVRREKT